MCFIGNIFLILNGAKTEFNKFLTKVNEFHSNIKLEYEMLK